MHICSLAIVGSLWKVRDLVDHDEGVEVVTNSELRENVLNNVILSKGTYKQNILLRI